MSSVYQQRHCNVIIIEFVYNNTVADLFKIGRQHQNPIVSSHPFARTSFNLDVKLVILCIVYPYSICYYMHGGQPIPTMAVAGELIHN